MENWIAVGAVGLTALGLLGGVVAFVWNLHSRASDRIGKLEARVSTVEQSVRTMAENTDRRIGEAARMASQATATLGQELREILILRDENRREDVARIEKKLEEMVRDVKANGERMARVETKVNNGGSG